MIFRVMLTILFVFDLGVIALAQERDNQAPSFVSVSPPNGSIVVEPQVIISGSLDDSEAQVILDDLTSSGGKVLNLDPLNFSFILPLNPGLNTFSISAVDSYGNRNAVTISITYDKNYAESNLTIATGLCQM